MKKIVYLAILLILLCLANPMLCEQFPGNWPFCRETRVETVQVLAEEKYGSKLRSIADQIMGPIDQQSPNPIAELSNLIASATTDADNNIITADQGLIIQQLCRKIERLNEKRELLEQEVAAIKERKFDTFGTQFDREQKRNFFLDDINRRWGMVVRQDRPSIMNDLAAIRSFERKREIDQTR